MYKYNNLSRFTICDDLFPNNNMELITEAVFTDGKKTMKPLVDCVAKIKQLLNDKINEDGAKFDPVKFWRSTLFKDLEDTIFNIFNFRNVQIHSTIEKYDPQKKRFKGQYLNCCIYRTVRYPIEGLVSEKGFYDKTRSTMMEVCMGLGLIQLLDPEEIVAVFLHEFGHSIDPALTEISYVETNVLSKYLTDRKNQVKNDERRYINREPKFKFIKIINNLSKELKKQKDRMTLSSFLDLFSGNDRRKKKMLDKIKQEMDKDKERFNRQNFAEVYADNFARMYGFGPQVISGIQKISKYYDTKLVNLYQKERKRQEVIVDMTISSIKDEHRTDVHRIRALLREYEEDLKNPDIPEKTKKNLKEDKEELEKILDAYLNDFDDFQNRVNRLINEELKKIEELENKGDDK